MKNLIKVGKVLLAVASILVPMALLVAGFWLPVNWACKAFLVLGMFGVIDMAIIFYETFEGKYENCANFTEALCKMFFWGVTVALVLLIGMSGYVLYTTGGTDMMLVEIALLFWLLPLVALGLHSPFAQYNLESCMHFCGAIMFLGVMVFICIHLFGISIADFKAIATALVQIGFAGCVVCGVLSVFSWIKRKIALG